MKLTMFLIAAALFIHAPYITHAADGKEKLQGKIIDVEILNKTDHKVKAHLKDHTCMYDVNKNRNFDLTPGASVKVRAETKASGGCFLAESSMLYEFTVVVPNISPIKVGECLITKTQSSRYKVYEWICSNQQVSDFYIGAEPTPRYLSINQFR